MSVVVEESRLEAPAGPVVPSRTRILEYFPIGLFGAVMSLTGLAIAWRLAVTTLGAPPWIFVALEVVSSLAFVVIAVCYLIKCFTAFDAVKIEFSHPIIGNLFGTLLISMLLQPVVIAQWSLNLARGMWMVGALGMTGFAWLIVTRWLTHRQQAVHATPAWIIPVVGMLDIPLAIPLLDLPDLHGVMIMSLAVGLFFGLPLFTLIFSRLVFEDPLPNPLAPTLLVLVAPFAVGVSTYFVTTGQVDLFSKSLYAIDIFVLAALFGRLRYLWGCCPFRFGWWAAGFPLAASSIAGLRIANASPGTINHALAAGLLAVTSFLILALLVRTLIGVFDGELRALST